MTLSLTVILIESTGNISFALPLIIKLISAKWMGDYFNEGIYDTNIEVAKVPMLPWYAKKSSDGLQIRQIMNSPPVCIRMKESMSRIVHILKTYSYNGFPVVDEIENEVSDTGPNLRVVFTINSISIGWHINGSTARIHITFSIGCYP